MAKVSIVMPVFNGEDFLRQSIESVLKQTYENWELIIVDDCSSDSSPAIIEEYIKKDPRVRSIRNEVNSKTPRSLNNGFAASEGEYLTWTTDDNEYYPDAIEKMVSYMEKHPDIQLVYTNMDLMDENGNVTGRFEQNDVTRMYYNDIVGGCFLYTRKCYEEVGEYKDDFFVIEDYEYFLRVLEKYGEFGHIEDRLYAFRMYGQSQSSQKFLYMKKLLNEGIRTPRFDFLFAKLKDNKQYLFGLYIDMLLTDSVSDEMLEAFRTELPEIDSLSELDDNDKNIIVYGAGDFGKRTFEILGDRIVCFSDRSESKIGTLYCGKPVISPEEAYERAKEQTVVIALESDLVYGVLKTFKEEGAIKISTFQKTGILKVKGCC